MSFLKDIRNQSEPTRKVMFVLAAIITVAVAGTLWVRKLRTDLFVLLNPDPQDQQAFRDAEMAAQAKPFAFIETGIERLQATLSGVFRPSSSVQTPTPTVSGEPRFLPLPKSR